MNILSFDVESNGLHGPAFAVAGLLINEAGLITSEFAARTRVHSRLDPFVRTEVMPKLTGMPLTHRTPRDLRQAFWDWYTRTSPSADLVVVQNGYPVEARFLIACQDDDRPARDTMHPFPLFDLPSLLYQIGARTRDERKTFILEATTARPDDSHDPRYDAWATAVSALAAIKIANP